MQPRLRQSVNETALCSPTNLTLSWKNICYSVKVKKNESYMMDFFRGRRMESINILNGVSGVVKSGTLMAILGSSGAGKTSLLATISRKIKKRTTGEILLNGKLFTRQLMSKISGFVPQEDLAIKSLTVQEHMEFMAKMKIDSRYRRVARSQKIDVLLLDLGLIELKNSKLSTLSNGEWKRVSLAVQLLTEPKILFCDEPTTGLDSYSATVVIDALKNIASKGRIVICSLHQPASGLLDHFHKIYLLATGNVAFQGSLSEAISFFSSLGYNCPTIFSHAEFFVSLLSTIRGNEEECIEKISKICEEFKKSVYGKRMMASIQEAYAGTSLDNNNDDIKDIVPHPIFAASHSPLYDFKKIPVFQQLKWLTWRNYIDYKRNSTGILLKFLIYIIGGLILATPYIHVTRNIDQRSIQNVQGLMYYIVTETIFTFHYAVFYTFPKEMPLLLRDMANGLYYPLPYYVSKVAVMIPGSVIQPFIYSALIYCITGLRGGFISFLYFVLPVILGAISAGALGCLMSALFDSFETASLLSVTIDFLTLIFSGIYLNLGNLPAHISWLKYISQFYYSTEAVSVTQWREYNYINCSTNIEAPCLASGEQVLENFGFTPGNYFIDLMGLVAIFTFSHFAGFLAIFYRSRKEPVY
ncbi:protein scarlet-like [Microplitis mediator]|uniref:protein scarlet-like n=1 Tax=Microplitis mediator TaxID=375433 RepID=UPI0025568E2C|nr:protein scarlet-like [Microplitis mediator]XP_057331764.1 protein scarlet-like [Microplitis mediator]